MTACSQLFRWAERELGRVDILVNSAGVNIKRRTMAEMEPTEWDRVMAINATGVYNCMREVLPGMQQRGDGLIVTISSISGLRASMLGGTAYSASKFAVAALTTAVALEYGKHGIRLTNVYPGEVDTPILEHRPQPVTAERRGVDAALRGRWRRRVDGGLPAAAGACAGADYQADLPGVCVS